MDRKYSWFGQGSLEALEKALMVLGTSPALLKNSDQTKNTVYQRLIIIIIFSATSYFLSSKTDCSYLFEEARRQVSDLQHLSIGA